jgi:hypothetical protein
MNAKELAEYCQSVGIGTIAPETGDLFYSYLPESPDNVICIYDSGGWGKDITIPRKDVTFQIIFRGANYDLVRSKIKLWEEHFVPGGIPKKLFYIGEYYIHFVQPMQAQPYPLGRDANDRDKFTWNFTFIVH